MKHAFTGANMVIIPAGIPRKSKPYNIGLYQRLTTYNR